MRFQDFLDERQKTRYEDKGVTTKDHGHKHDFYINRMTGDGATSKDSGHSHKIRKMIVLPAENFKNDHIHQLDVVK